MTTRTEMTVEDKELATWLTEFIDSTIIHEDMRDAVKTWFAQFGEKTEQPVESEDMGEFWRDVKESRQEKRARNRKSSAEMLQAAGIRFESKNGGSHLIVRADMNNVVDFWPGTGLWIHRVSKQRGRGVKPIIDRFRGRCAWTAEVPIVKRDWHSPEDAWLR